MNLRRAKLTEVHLVTTDVPANGECADRGEVETVVTTMTVDAELMTRDREVMTRDQEDQEVGVGRTAMVAEAAAVVVVDRSTATIAETRTFLLPRRTRHITVAGHERRIAFLSEKRQGSFRSGGPRTRHVGSRRNTIAGTIASADGVAVNQIELARQQTNF